MYGIQAARKAKGMTQSDLSALSGVPRNNIARYETGRRNPPVMVLAKIAKALDKTLDELVDIEQSRKIEMSKKDKRAGD